MPYSYRMIQARVLYNLVYSTIDSTAHRHFNVVCVTQMSYTSYAKSIYIETNLFTNYWVFRDWWTGKGYKYRPRLTETHYVCILYLYNIMSGSSNAGVTDLSTTLGQH